jgi:hypothetical protein
VSEQIVAENDGILCWKGAKMGMTVLNAKMGKLVLTDQRLLFLSAGKSGGLDVPLSSVLRCEAGKKRALVVWHRNDDGAEAAHAFGQQMGMPSRDAWVAEINRLRGATLN